MSPYYPPGGSGGGGGGDVTSAQLAAHANTEAEAREAALGEKLDIDQVGMTIAELLGEGLVDATAATAPVLRLRSGGPTGQYTLSLDDAATHGHDILHIEHAGDGTTGPTTQAYAINIANQTGARPALVIHQYSNNGAAVRIDNTDISATLQIWNTENPSKNPGRTGTGPFFQLHPYGATDELYLTNDLVWLNNTTKNFKVLSTAATAYTFGVDSAQNIPGLYVTKTGTGAGAGIYVSNAGTSPGLDLYQNGVSGLGFRVTAATGHTTYAFQIKGQIYGGSFETEINSAAGHALLLNKKGTGSGEGLRIINAGTGASVSLRTASAEVARLNPNGEYEHLTAGAGVILKSPDGTRHRVSVTNEGTIEVAELV